MAIKKIYDLSVDLKRTSVRVNIPVLVQGDSAEFRIRLLDNGAELSTAQLPGITAVKMQSGYDAQTVIQTVGALEGSVAVFRLQKGELFRSGTVQAMVQLEDADDRISTLRFQYQVIPDLEGNYVPGEQDVTIFQRYISDAQKKIDDINAAAEILAATDVGQLTAQLAETVEIIPSVSNATSILEITNPYADFQNIHPKVLYFENGWNGYRFWMAYTPYPNGSTIKENPCLAVSNDMITWTVPTGFNNAVLDDWNGVPGAYNNDTHMVYRADLNRMEMWWRFTDSTTDLVHLYRRTTTDGVTWTARETMFTGNRRGDDHISPAIIFEDNKYKMISVNTVGPNRIMNYSESADGSSWGTRIQTVVDWGTLTPWHPDFIKVDGKYEMVLQAWELGKTNNTASLYYLESNDLINFSKPIKIMSPSPITKAFDGAGLYRSSLLKINGIYYLFYSGLNESGFRAISLSYGQNIRSLRGYTGDGASVVGDLPKLSLKTGGNRVELKQNETINNTVDVMQTSSPGKYGGVKVGNILFADGVSDGVTPQEGSMRFNGTTKKHQVYTGTAWLDLVPAFLSNKLLFAAKSTEQALVNNTPVVVNFETKYFDKNNFVNNNTLSTGTDGIYQFNIGLQLLGVADAGDIEIYVQNGTSKLRTLAKQKILPDASGGYFVEATGVLTSYSTYNLTVVVVYKGTAVSPKISQYATQNYIFVLEV